MMELAGHRAGDRVSIFPLVTAGREPEEGASQMFAEYSEALAKKYSERRRVSRGEKSLSFDTADGAVFLRCSGRECVTLEGGEQEQFARWVKRLGWPQNPPEPARPGDPKAAEAQIQRTL